MLAADDPRRPVSMLPARERLAALEAQKELAFSTDFRASA